MDTNFFLAVDKRKNKEKFTLLKEVLNRVHRECPLYITKRIFNELPHDFKEIARLYFKTMTVKDSTEFSRFCTRYKNFLGYSKKRNEPADLSLIFSALKDNKKSFVVTNDEGFLRVKKVCKIPNVEIIEPTDFFSKLIEDFEFEEGFIEKIEQLILFFAEYFIMYRLTGKKKPRPIERILKSILTFGTHLVESSPSEGPPQDYQNAILTYLEKGAIDKQDQALIRPIIPLLEPLKEYKSDLHDSHSIRYLYLKTSENLQQLDNISSNLEIANHLDEVKTIISKQIFKIRIQETVHYLSECYFDEAFTHFRLVLESDWRFRISKERELSLKLLYGIFLLNLREFAFLEYIISEGFWDGFPHLNKIFGIFNEIRHEDVINSTLKSFLSQVDDSDIKLFYDLGLYFSNTGNSLGLRIFMLLFQMEEEELAKLEWSRQFLERFLLEVRIKRKDITDEMRAKLSDFLEPQMLEDNTKSVFDSSNELNEFTPVGEAPYFYRQPFYLIESVHANGKIEAYCWNTNIKSIVILKFPAAHEAHLKNVRAIKIKQGYIKTKRISFRDRAKKPGRIIIMLNVDCDITFQRFQLELEKK